MTIALLPNLPTVDYKNSERSRLGIGRRHCSFVFDLFIIMGGGVVADLFFYVAMKSLLQGWWCRILRMNIFDLEQYKNVQHT